MRICIVPRWGGSADDDWYSWLARQLSGHDVRVAPLRPHAGAPEIDACIASIGETISRDPEKLARTVLVGHSVGCQAALRFLESVAPTARVAGVLCVAGWFWIDAPWGSIRPWIDAPMDRAKVADRARTIRVLISDDDPYTADHAENARQWERAVGASVRMIPGARHFNRAREPEVLAAVRGLVE